MSACLHHNGCIMEEKYKSILQYQEHPRVQPVFLHDVPIFLHYNALIYCGLHSKWIPIWYLQKFGVWKWCMKKSVFIWKGIHSCSHFGCLQVKHWNIVQIMVKCWCKNIIKYIISVSDISSTHVHFAHWNKYTSYLASLFIHLLIFHWPSPGSLELEELAKASLLQFSDQ